ncbi:MAG: heavy metal translocating P-type ATPase metal-binding domain-containing protein [Verrucomicrobia bacterium]|nr:heavy metal translocating P-type ATPase metal-binding domain-containing protein [Verrucomicrobiota bacterium]
MNAPESSCLHCGTPVPPDRTRFCCAGCEHVFTLLTEGGFDNFYNLRGNSTLAPVPPQALRERDWQWLEELAAQAEARTSDASSVQLDLAVQGLSCLGCVWLIDSVFKPLAGAQRIEIQPTRGLMRVTWHRGVFNFTDFARRVQQFGYLLGKGGAVPAGEVFSLGRRTGVCAAFALNAMAFSLPAYLGMERTFLFASWFDLIAACSATLALLVGGSYFAQRSFAALRRGVLHIDTPITLGIAAAWLGSMAGWLGGVNELRYFDFVAIFIFLMLAGRWLQQSAVERNRRRLLQSTSIPESVTKTDAAGNKEIVPIAQLARGDVLLIKPGEVFPVTCTLQSPHATLSLEWINGESEAASRNEGQHIPSGALNIGTLTVEATSLEPWDTSLLHQLADTTAATSSAPLLAGLLSGYLAAVVLIGIAGFAYWFAHGADAGHALQIMISVFVVSCPCALGVATPFADDMAATTMERLGVFVRAAGIWQKLARVRTIVFDKTGTLTMENPQLINPEALDALNAPEKSALRVLVAANLHPVSRSLFEALGAMPEKHNMTVEEIIGQGVKFTDDQGKTWSLGRPGSRAEEADTIFTRDGVELAAFRFRESLRPQTVAAFDTLRRKHFAMHLLSGDRTEKVARTAQLLQIPPASWRAEMTPAEKAAQVAALDPQRTLYLGDGANDSLAFAEALCTGSPVTGRNFLEHKADFYFLGNSLRFLPDLLDTASRRRRAVRQVFAFAVTYNIVTIIVSLTGHMSPLLAAILMPLSSLATIGIVRLSCSARPRERIQSRVQTAPLAKQILRSMSAPVIVD